VFVNEFPRARRSATLGSSTRGIEILAELFPSGMVSVSLLADSGFDAGVLELRSEV